MRTRMLTRASLGAVALLIASSHLAGAQQPPDPDPRTLRSAVRGYRAGHEAAILRELVELVSIPNVASDRVNIRKNAEYLVSMLRRRGVETRLLESEGSPPAVYGELRAPGAVRTIVMYAHYDGQPALGDPRWSSDPWVPVFRDTTGREVSAPDQASRISPAWRLYARSASDDKAPIVAMLAALDALRAARQPLSVNVKFFFEGEEEAGSPHLSALLERHAELLRADAWIFCDGPVHQSRRMQVVFGVRGVQDLEMTVYGPNRPLHSGHYGNWAPNPIILLLTHLLAGMRDTDGGIRVSGFYDDVRPLTPAESGALAAAPDVDGELRRSLGLARTEAGGGRLAERVMLPALNLRGIQSGSVGERATNAIPTEATASIDFRLVPDQTPARVRALVEAHVRRQGFFIVRADPDSAERRRHARIVKLEWGDGYPATRTQMALPVSRAVTRVISEALGEPVIRVSSLGGSLPMYLFAEVTKAPLVIVPIVNHDNNQHAPNENLRIQNLWDGIEIYAALLARLGPAWREEAPRSGGTPAR